MATLFSSGKILMLMPRAIGATEAVEALEFIEAVETVKAMKTPKQSSGRGT